MSFYKQHSYLTFLHKNLNCIFLLNQICQANPLMGCSKQYFTQSSAYNLSFQKYLPRISQTRISQCLRKSFSRVSTPNFITSPTQRLSTQAFSTIHEKSLENHFQSSQKAKAREGTSVTSESLKSPAMPNKTAASHMVWVDCEMTGLDPREHCILEVACLITDAHLNVLDQIEIVIHKSEEILQGMNEWCVEHHIASGLVDRVRASSVSSVQADEMLTQFVSKYVKPKTAPMIGNSIYMDRMFIVREFPMLNDYLHYRIIDVSSLKELCKMYNHDLYLKVPKKRLKHRGLEDIEDTIVEFKFYKQHFLKLLPTTVD